MTKRNTQQGVSDLTQCRSNTMSNLLGIRQAAAKDRRLQFTALFHHITPYLLKDSFFQLKRKSAAGADGVTWHNYQQDLDNRLKSLHERLHRRSYRPRAARRIMIPKADGGERPISVFCLEDKIVQQAVVKVLEGIYENDFRGFSYGYRTMKSQHDALDALTVGIKRNPVNWVLDLDIRKFFEQVEHDWLIRFLEHRVRDKRIIRLIIQWIKVGHYDDDGRRVRSERGMPQGSVISPLLSNIYLHYVFDLWVDQWRKRKAFGRIIVVRFADDSVLGFQREHDAKVFLSELGKRLGQFGLSLHEDKTRLIRFGRFARVDSKKREKGKPETFTFLGFTHICGISRSSGNFNIVRRTSKERMRATLRKIKSYLMKHRHDPVPEQLKWLKRVLQGHMNYFSVPGNGLRINAFRTAVQKVWYKALKRRSQRSRLNWKKFGALINTVLPKVKVLHPWPEQRFDVKYSR